jgi:DNA gyrase subunit B
MDAEALRAIADGVRLNLDTVADAEASASRCRPSCRRSTATSAARPKWRRVRRAHRQADPAHQPPAPRQHQEQRDHAGLRARRRLRALAEAADTFRGLLREGAR